MFPQRRKTINSKSIFLGITVGVLLTLYACAEELSYE